MPDLRERARNRWIRLPGQFAEPVLVEELEDEDGILFVRVRTAAGEAKEITEAAETIEKALEAAEGAPVADFVPPRDVFLLVESARIRHAYAWDPYFAVSLAGIEALPHQLSAVYEHMLPQARLRFLLADDPGAGKTIMAGLLVKELRLRGAVERILILCPAPLTIQWQDELHDKFDETFEIITSAAAREQLAGSPWHRHPRCIASMDFAKQEHIAPELLRERWDLVIIDEAHKASMPNVDDPTMRYKLVKELADRTERLVLLTATPHQGNSEQFRNLLGLLDPHAFRNESALRDLLQREDSPWILRRMKEDLRDFEGKKLFVKRHAYTEEFDLSRDEWDLYRDVTDYINRYLPKQTGRRKQSAALARIVLQRRLASSIRAIRASLERRHTRLRTLLDELDSLPQKDRDQRLRQLANLPVDPEMESDDETTDLDDLAQQAVMAERYETLVDEVHALEELTGQALGLEAKGPETKLKRLFDVLKKAEFKELEDRSGRLLIFTEQRDTLEHLRENLEREGYSCCVIHGGMDAVARKQAQYEFLNNRQICIATDAAGEGINLQFCHLMINYDVPWNPMRLEQRMGRIHRFGQEREVHVFNFVAISGPDGPESQPVVEGRVLARLLAKIDTIRDEMGDRVYDVIGLLLRLNGVNLEEALREASYDPGLLSDYVDEIEKISEQRLTQYEQSTGIALAKRIVDLSRIRGQDFVSEEKRLMPEYVESYFLEAADRTSLRWKRRANPKLLTIENVPGRFVAPGLLSVRERGPAAKTYRKATFHKSERKKRDNIDAVLLSPGHPLYAAVDELLAQQLRSARLGTARYLDPWASKPYRLHFFEMVVEGESLGDPGEAPRTQPVHERLVVVREHGDGTIEQAQPDLLHDLTEVDGAGFPDVPWDGPASPDDLGRATRWVRAKLQHPLVEEHRAQRAHEVEIRREFLARSFKASIDEAQARYFELHARVLSGEEAAALARDEADRRRQELEQMKEHRLRALDHMGVVRAGRVSHVASVLVAPADAPVAKKMRRDDAIELAAVAVAIQHEEARGWEVHEVWKDHDGSGFDLRSVSPPDVRGVRSVRRIEVKGRSSDGAEVHLTANEWRQAERLKDTYWLYVVWEATGSSPRLKMVQDPFRKLRDVAETVMEIKGHRIPGPALEQADGEEWKA